MAAFVRNSQGASYLTAANEDGSSIVVYEQGAHLASWKNKDGEEMLYMSPNAKFANRVALRGGVPLIFPQFGSRGKLSPSHGFARIRPWAIGEVGNGKASFTLHVSIDEIVEQSVKMSDSSSNALALTYTITFSNDALRLEMAVENKSEEVSASFMLAFHTYFAADVDHTIVSGVDKAPYIDNTRTKTDGDKIRKPQPLLYIQKEHDRIYPNIRSAILLQNPSKGHILYISGENLPDCCVWNPWIAKCSSMSDMPADGYKNFICVEHGEIVKQTSVIPGGKWVGAQEIRVLRAKPAKL